MPAALDVLLAALPIALVAGLLALRVKPIPAILITIGVTLALSFRFAMTPETLADSIQSLLPVTITVVLIIFGGIMLAEFLSVSGAQEKIGGWLAGATHGRDRAVLLLGLGITPLAESIIGWGVGVIIGVPLFMRIGLNATKSATLGLLALVVAPWGSLAPGIIVMSEIGGVDLRALGVWSAILNLPALLILGIAISIVGMGARGALRMAGETLGTVLIMWLALVAANAWLGVPLAGVLASFAAIAVVLVLARLRGPIPSMGRDTLASLMPYLLLVVGLLLTTAVAAVFDLGAFGDVASSPALWLLVAAASAPLLLGTGRADATTSVRRALVLFWPVTVVTILFITFGGLLSANGMTSTLAQAAAMLGTGFLLVIPVIGFIGGYVTASNTAVSAMFAGGVAEAAGSLGANPAVALAAQNVSTGAAVMTAPSRVALAISVADGLRRSGEEAARPAKAIATVLIANAAIMVTLAPLTLLLATASF